MVDDFCGGEAVEMGVVEGVGGLLLLFHRTQPRLLLVVDGGVGLSVPVVVPHDIFY